MSIKIYKHEYDMYEVISSYTSLVYNGFNRKEVCQQELHN